MSIAALLAGASGGRLFPLLSNKSLSSIRPSGNAQAGYRMLPDGRVQTNEDGVWSNAGSYSSLIYGGVGARFESKAVLLSGSISGSTLTSWESNSATLQWSLTVSPNNQDNGTLHIETRTADAPNFQDSATVTLYVEAGVA